MDFSDFRSRAIAEGKRYGKDEYVFVREFAQNARDAGASRIVLNTDYSNGELSVSFMDDGSGMSFSHAKEYLFTLYASSKEDETASAGQFGVGFWSILLFSPDRIVIHSTTPSESWGVEFNQNLDGERRVDAVQSQHGTSVTAYKQMSPQAATIAIAEMETALTRYCRYLRRNDRTASPLEVRFNSKRIDGPLTLEGDCTATFEYADVQGAVALGKSPKVNLYVRGLPVWMGTSLSELQYGASPEVQMSYPRGLAPMYLLNGNKLSVTLDRRSVFDDAALQRARRIAQREMRKLIAGYLDQIAPRTLRSRIEYFFSSFVEDFRLHFSKRMAPLWLVPTMLVGAAALLWLVFPEWVNGVLNNSEDENDPAAEVMALGGRGLRSTGEYRQATTQAGEGQPIDLLYTPTDESFYFRSQVAEILDVQSGARSGPLTPYRIPADYRCKTDCVRISVGLDDRTGVYHLPVPTGYYIDAHSVQTAPGQKGELVRSVKDDWLFIQKAAAEGGGKLVYSAGRATTSIHNMQPLLQLPSIRLPNAFKEALAGAKAFKSRKERVDRLSLFVEASIAYDTSENTAEKYQRFFHAKSNESWFDFVFQLGKGDCDVKNILLIMLLRELRIPSRLAVGYVGKNGETRAGKHAWVEYYDNGWQISDATGQSMQPSSSTVTTDTSAPDGSEEIDTDTQTASPASPAAEPSPRPVSLPKDAPPRPAPVNSNAARYWLVAAGVLLLLLPPGIRLLMRLKRCRPSKQPSRKQEQLAAQMLQAALEDAKLHPSGSGLFSRNLIPTWKPDCRISMNRVIALGKRGRLFYSTRKSSLVDRLLAAKAVVVDASNDAFIPVIGRMSGSFFVDELDALKPVKISTKDAQENPARQVVAKTIAMADAAGLPRNCIIPCMGNVGALFKEMDLSWLPFSWKKDIPNRFVAVSISDTPRFEKLLQLGGGTEGASLLLLDRVVAHCAMFRSCRSTLRALLAERESELQK